MRTPTILIADDEETVRIYIRRILAAQGFQVLEATDGVDAMEQIERMDSPVDLLLTDVRMPRMDGPSLAHSVTERYPETAVLFISGYPLDLERERSRHPRKACSFLPKPFTPKLLVEAVAHCLSGGSPKSDAAMHGS